VLDYVNYRDVHADRSYGSFPDGQPFDRQEFFYVTPAGTNDGRSAPLVVFINEWMASNIDFMQDPADNDFDDWFELYNPSTNSVDLTGYYLTDSLTNAAGVVTNKLQFRITTNMAHIIPPGGHLLVWADNETGQNTTGSGAIRPDLHVNFALSKSGEAIGLFAADGTQIDYVRFGAQVDNDSQGRCPDGSANIRFYDSAQPAPDAPTPRTANLGCGGVNLAPVLDPIANKTIYLTETVTFTAQATDPDFPAQTLTFSLDAGAPAGASIHPTTGVFSWTPGEVGTNFVIVRVTDNGTPPLSDSQSVTVRVISRPNFGSVTRSGNDLTLEWGTTPGRTYRVQYKDNIDDAQWSNFGQPLLAETETLSITDDMSAHPKRFYRLKIEN
jgi:hypothetical protein